MPRIARDGYPYKLPQPAGAMTYRLNGAQVGRGNILNIEGSGIYTTPLDDGITYHISGGGGGGGTIIGDPVTGGIANEILYTNALGNLSQNGGLIFDDINQVFRVWGQTNNTKFIVDDPSFAISAEIPGTGYFKINNSSGQNLFLINLSTDTYQLGDIDGSNNSTRLMIDDVQERFTVEAGGGFKFYVDGLLNYVQMGDISGIGNNTKFLVDDVGKNIEANTDGQFYIKNTAGKQFTLVSPVTNTYSFGDLNTFNNGSRISIEDNSLRMTLIVQDFYIDGYNGNHSFFIESTNTYHDLHMGDVGLNTNQVRLLVLDSDNKIEAYALNHFSVQRPAGSQGLLIDFANNDYALGDLSGAVGSNLIWIEDDNSIISVRTPGYFHVTNPSNEEWFKVDVSNNVITIGDLSSVGNDTILKVDDASKQSIEFTGGLYYHGAVHIDSAVTTAYTVQPQDQIIYVDTTTAVVTITLPSVITNDHRRIIVKDMGNASVNNIFIVAAIGVVNDGIINVDHKAFTWQAANFNNVWYHIMSS